jgi:uncharacterized protein (UPF0332 family)
MAAKKINTTKIDKNKYQAYLKKASDFFDAAHQAFLAKNWNAAGLSAVHCAISSCDALLVFFRGQRSTSENHYAAAELLQQCSEINSVDELTSRFRRILAKKNVIEYEERQFSQSEAEEIIKQTERFFSQTKILLLK